MLARPQELNFGDNVEVVGAILNVMGTANNNFVNIKFSIKAEDIRPVGSQASKKDDFTKKLEEKRDDKEGSYIKAC